MKNKSFLNMMKNQLEIWLTSPDFKLKKLIKTGSHEQLEEKYNKLKDKVEPKTIIESYLDLITSIRIDPTRFNSKKFELLLNNMDETKITSALLESFKIPIPQLWDIFFQNENLKSKINFNNPKIINWAVQFNAVEVVPYLVKEQDHILKDEIRAREILKKCINDKREEIVQILLAADINCDSFKQKTEVIIPRLLEFPPMYKALSESENPVMKSIKSYIFSSQLEETLAVKIEPKKKKQKI
jgi:DNA-binding phage protein